MFLIILGGDLRYAHAARIAAERSIEAAAIGFERCPLSLPACTLGDLARAQAVLMPNPWRSGIQLPFADPPFTLEDALGHMSPGTLLILSDISGMPELPSGIEAADLSADEGYVLKNAHLTAECAIGSAVSRSDRAIAGSRCLIIGYGRIGQRLADLLRMMGGDTAAAARRAEVRRTIRLNGHTALDMQELAGYLRRAHFIFNTVPAPVLPAELLRTIRPDALVMDLASPPYGFDLRAAQELGLNACRENGLPGRMCAVSAAEELIGAALRRISPHLKGGSPCN